MPTTEQITFFACGNGDSVLIESHGKTVMTDINYRADGAQDSSNDEVPDFAPDIRKACPDDHLDIFVLTHPDQDHLTGFGEIFHLGDPGDWDGDPEDGHVKIIVDEIWCSPYSVAPNYTTDVSKPVLDEIKRRDRLRGTVAGEQQGNKLVVMDTSTHDTGLVDYGFEWKLLAPTETEADIPVSPDPDKRNSSNPSSLVIRWTITVGGSKNRVLLGGDSTVEVWERIYDDYYKSDPDALSWHILMALHHCSRRSIGRVENKGSDNEKFVPSAKAEAALGQKLGTGNVVSSSNRVVKGGTTPPSYHAKDRYLKILAGAKAVDDKVRERFRCTGGNKSNDKPAHVVYRFTKSGPARGLAAPAIVGASSSARGGGYG